MNFGSIYEWLKYLETQPPSELNIANIPSENSENKFIAEIENNILSELPNFLKLRWSINHIVNISSEKSLDLLVTLLLKTVNFSHSYHAYFPGFSNSAVIPSLIVAPNTSAVQYFFSGTTPNHENMLYHQDKTEVTFLQNYFNKLREKTNLFMETKGQSDASWHTLIANIEAMPGERLQARELFTTLTEPASLHRKYYQALGFPSSDIEKLISMNLNRADALKEQIGYYRFLNIAERKSIEKYIATGERAREHITASCEEVEQQVQMEIELLQKFPNYYLGLTEEEVPVALQIKSNKVLIEVIKPVAPTDRAEEAAYINTDSQALIESFHRYYEKMWHNIDPNLRQKTGVIKWLQTRLNMRKAYDLI